MKMTSHNRICLLALTISFFSNASAATAEPIKYPDAKRIEHVDTYHGNKVEDPYRWLENPALPETKAWIEEENKVTQEYLKKIPVRDAIKSRLTELWNFEKMQAPYERGGKLFYRKNSGLQNQDILYVQDKGSSEPRVLLDPNKLSSDGTAFLAGTAVSDDAKYIAYGISKSGSDWQEWFVKDIATGQDTKDHLEWIKFSSASWTKDGQGFYYCRYLKPKEEDKYLVKNLNHEVYYHKLGDDQSKDVLIYKRTDQPEWFFDPYVTNDGKYLILTAVKGSEATNRLFYKDLSKPDSKIVELLTKNDAKYEFVDNDDSNFILKTTFDAPFGRVVSMDSTKSENDKSAFKELVPETKNVTVIGVGSVGKHLFVVSLKDAYSQVSEYDFSGKKVRDLDLPGMGAITGFYGDQDDKVTYFRYSSFNTPLIVYKLDIASGESSVFFEPKLKFLPKDFITIQAMATSKDGTKIPLFITRKSGTKFEKTTPCYLYGYGGFDISMEPSFSPTTLTWMEMGGIYVQAILRGGGEFGRAWHEAGTKLQKQNVFDDFQASAQWLIENDYTSAPKLAIAGGSNGGLLVGACITQKPNLYGAACPAVGVMDMLRFNKFTEGWAWVSDYGSPENADEFKALHAYSPLHNIKSDTKYPATFITTGDTDDRVVPAHSFKFAAQLQKSQAGDKPVLIRIETKAGHGAGKPTDKQIAEITDKLAFLAHELNFEEQANKELTPHSR